MKRFSLDNALQNFKLIKDLQGQSDVYEYYGIIRRSFGKYESNLDILYKALKLRKQTGYKDGEALCDKKGVAEQGKRLVWV